jgi:3-hydroxybutyryl-CoA dehydratase
MMKAGDSLHEVHRLIDQARIEQYAKASGDFNPIHIDQDFAAQSQFGGTIAHGMMVAATISEMMTSAFGRHWSDTGSMKIRFRSPVKPGQSITALGTVKAVSASDLGRRVVCAVSVVKDDGETAIAGQAEVTLTAS